MWYKLPCAASPKTRNGFLLSPSIQNFMKALVLSQDAYFPFIHFIIFLGHNKVSLGIAISWL